MATKKTRKKTAAADKKKSAPVAAAPCACGGGCGCGCWKKVITFVLGAVVGAAACCVVCKGCCGKKMWKRGGHEMAFKADGCLDLSKIRDPQKLEMIKARAGGKDCITKEDLFGGERPQGPRKPRKPRPQAPAI